MYESKIPKALLDKIKEGKVILFLGAGAAFDSKHPNGDKPPSGNQLANLISEKFLGPNYLDRDLQYVSELAISETDLFTVQKFVSDIFRQFKPGDHHLRIPLYKWHSIYTTNYDLLIEDSYDKVRNRQQVLATFIKNGERIQDKMSIPNSVMYNKLHGSITDITDEKLPLILTPDQYVDHLDERDRLFGRLKESSFEYSILYVGFSFADLDIRSTLKELNKKGDARPRSYMIGPNITEEESRFWDSKKISSIKLSFKSFIDELDKSITENERILSSIVREDFSHPIMAKFQANVSEPTEGLIEFINRDVTYLHTNLAEKDTEPKVFYKGYFEGWDPILKNYDVNRKVTDSILSDVFLVEEDERGVKQELFLIKGNAGSGKTVLMHRLAWDAAITFEKLCLYYKSDVPLEYNRFAELYQLVKERIYLFIDGVVDKVDDIEYLLNKAKKDNIQITIICSERTNVWNVGGDRLNTFLIQDYTLQYLNDKEIDDLIVLLKKHKSLGYLTGKSIEEQRYALSERSGRELLVALYEATAGKPFADIVMNEFKSIPSEEAQSLYLSICIFHRIGAYARAGIISRLHEINFSYFQDKLFKPLESVVYHHRNYVINDYVFTTRHQHIAELVFEQVLIDQESRYEKYISIISKLDIDYDSDKQVFIALTNAKKLMEVFRDPNKIRELYNIAYENIGEQAALMQQESIFEMNHNDGDLEKANMLLNRAHEIEPKNSSIAHSKAEFLLRKATNNSQNLVIKSLLKSSKDICQDIISNKKNRNIVHAYHTLLKIYILELEKFLEENNSSLIEKKIQDFEKTLAKAMQNYPNESFLFDAEASFNNLLDNSPKALASLKSAFEVNKRSPYLAIRLSNYYIDNDNIENALIILKESIDINVNSKDLNFKYAILLMKKNSENYIDLKHYLRKSFVKNDKRYDAQFWYARTLYLLEEDEYLDYFEYLKDAPLDSRFKKKQQGIVTINNIPKIYEGTIIKLENYFGFIKQDINGERIYFYRNSELSDLRFNSRVKFNKLFNYSGPIASIIV
ncbi:SIR2 family NAD-dependent protein deacylase [Wenyingzhuangia marina]|uniref:SIR2-like domain-containing protein n=1 Tax=Wenyingzhuangia marina TaxID=1195760 RepID=A0A1M5TYP0_9FLAO|nr:SIR2 family protein [Wenyingzhuangia marina]GGF70525.1 SIR2 family protein [Wenyingzhuangia marina]SHH55503.1 SIR2-like domain-containing protein [Wenyingzhuangia marina]